MHRTGMLPRCAALTHRFDAPFLATGIFPLSADGFEQLQAAMERLTLNDASGGAISTWLGAAAAGACAAWLACVLRSLVALTSTPPTLTLAHAQHTRAPCPSHRAPREQQCAWRRLPLWLPGSAAHGRELRAGAIGTGCGIRVTLSSHHSPHSPPTNHALTHHALQVFRQRLEQEHGASVLVTAPTVPCR